MKRAGWIVLFLVSVAALPAAAQRSAPMGPAPKTAKVELPDPPEGTSRNVRTLRSNMMRLARYTGSDCPLKLESLQDQLKRMATTIQQLEKPEDKAAFSSYYEKTLLAHIRGHSEGVPGFGTWAELEKQRTDGLAALEQASPKATGVSEKEIRAFAVASYQYAQLAAKQHAFAKDVLARGLCIAPKFDQWVAFTAPEEASARLKKLREPIMPRLDVVTAAKLIEADAKASYTRLLDLGTAVRECASAYVAMGKEADKVKVLETWATVLGGESEKQLRAYIANHATLREQVAAVYAKRLKEVAPPAEVKAAAGLAKKVIKGAIAIRATSEIRHVDQEQSKVITKGGKEYLRKWREVFDTFDIHYVTKTKPHEWMVDMPGVPLSGVCTLWVAGAFKYSKGLDVKIGAWHSAEENVIAPISCDRASATFAP